jgi:hypothetical protein
MDRVGVEPTTSAPAISERLLLYCLYLKGRKRELRAKPPPPLSADFFPPLHTSDISISFHPQQLCSRQKHNAIFVYDDMMTVLVFGA